MGTRIDLPEGGWADLRDVTAVPERLRRPVTRAAAKLGVLGVTELDEGDMPSPDQIDGVVELNDNLVVALVAAWSLDVPITLEAVLDLPSAVYDTLTSAVAGQAVALVPDFRPSPKTDSPTEPSSD